MALASEVHVLLSTLESLPMALMATDGNGVIRWANACLTNLTGYAVEEIVGQNAGILMAANTSNVLREFRLLSGCEDLRGGRRTTSAGWNGRSTTCSRGWRARSSW